MDTSENLKIGTTSLLILKGCLLLNTSKSTSFLSTAQMEDQFLASTIWNSGTFSSWEWVLVIYVIIKKRHKFADTPSDKCLCKNGVEDTHHFLITCTFYTRHRNVLLASVETILQKYDLDVTNLVEVLLYSHPSLDVPVNRTILLATLEFIDNTKRFEKWLCIS